MKYLALTVAFILELIAFIFFAGVGFTFPISTLWKILIATILLIALIGFWSLCMAPKAPKKVTVAKYYVFKAGIYTISAYSIFILTAKPYFIAFIIVALLDEIVLFRHNLQSR